MNRVVITGMGVISPVGNDVATFWENVKMGKCGISRITKFDTAPFKVKVAGEVRNFDARQFMNKLDILHSDLYAQFAVAAACQAMDDSGISENISADRFGVYFGTGIGGISTFMTEYENLLNKGPRKVSPYFIPMMIANMASAMIAIRFNCKNSVMPMVTACASGSNAIGEAMRLIRHGYADAMICGGSEATVNTISAAGFSNMQALSFSDNPLEASLPFDERRTGFVMGEGAGALILENYENAVKRDAHIYAEICGYGSTCDAYHMTSPHLDAEASSKAIYEAIKESSVDADRIYYNAHGTGTKMNDKIETIALKKALGEKNARKIHISSTKSVTGHMLGAAGAIEAIISVLSLNQGIVPPTVGLKVADPDCDLDYTPNNARKTELDLALSSSLGFGGHNACLAFKKIGDN